MTEVEMKNPAKKALPQTLPKDSLSKNHLKGKANNGVNKRILFYWFWQESSEQVLYDSRY
jgi:hypothetical protein